MIAPVPAVLARGLRTRFGILGIALFFSYAYFYQSGGWNQNSRFDLVRAIVGQRTLRIDAFQDNTGDKALYRRHWYSDKAPGLALSAVPIVEIAWPALQAMGIAPESDRGVSTLSYLATIATSGLAAGVVAALVVLATYNTTAFGAPLHIGYASEAGAFPELKTGFFGITYPKPDIIRELLVGQFRGLLPLAPVLALMPLGWWWWY